MTQDEYAEANAITVQQTGLVFEIQLGHFCNNRCNFCISGDMTERGLAQKISLPPILEAIKSGRSQGATKMIFLGGEPTLHDGFLDALSYAVNIGFEHIVIFSNGARMGRPKFMDACLKLGNFEWRISIQGGTEEAHDLTTGLKGSFGRIRKGLTALAERNQLITTNMCICSTNYQSVVRFPQLLNTYNISQLHLDIIRPMSTPNNSAEELTKIMPHHSEVAKYIRIMLEELEETNPDFDINIGNLPFCLLPEWANKLEHGGIETITVATNESELEPQIDKYEWHKSARIKAPQCNECAFATRCNGIYREYGELYGTDELTCISFNELQTLDKNQRAFPILAQHWLPTLTRAVGLNEGPIGWDLISWTPDYRRRNIELQLRSTTGEYGLLVIQPKYNPPSAPDNAWTVLASNRYSLRLQASPLHSTEELTILLKWLGTVLPEEDQDKIDIGSYLHARRKAAEMRTSVLKLAQSLKTFQPGQDWVCLPPTISDDGLVAALEYRKQLPSEEFLSIILRLYPVSKGNRFQIGMKLESPRSESKPEQRFASKRLIERIRKELAPV